MTKKTKLGNHGQAGVKKIRYIKIFKFEKPPVTISAWPNQE